MAFPAGTAFLTLRYGWPPDDFETAGLLELWLETNHQTAIQINGLPGKFTSEYEVRGSLDGDLALR